MSEVQSSAISKMKAIWRRLTDKEYRDALVSFKIDNDLSAQIYALRNQQGLTQEELGKRAGGMAQSRIATIEGSCNGVSLTTLKRIASAFDIGLSVRFVSFNELISQSVKEDIDRRLPDFLNDVPPAEQFKITIYENSHSSSRRERRVRWDDTSSSGRFNIRENIGGQKSARL